MSNLLKTQESLLKASATELLRTDLLHQSQSQIFQHVEFLVKWLNYPSDKNTWEPYSSLRDVVKLHDYLRHNNMTNLINKQHR